MTPLCALLKSGSDVLVQTFTVLVYRPSFIGYILEKKWEYKGTVHQLFIDLKKAYDSVKREVLYNILIEFGIPKKLVRLIKMCLSETYSRVRIVFIVEPKNALIIMFLHEFRVDLESLKVGRKVRPHLWSNGQRVWLRNQVARVRIPVGESYLVEIFFRGFPSTQYEQMLGNFRCWILDSFHRHYHLHFIQTLNNLDVDTAS
ncbi:hypothetical protein ANN_16154 [Periplaneta americana]|uniref:Reverse transcriptase domain-containing protein n=1 Tax=Periplaneta americana TaxID=6978 RepID=A0ABQ8SIB4_PERAM|nr:hypothetical protein ANN_16154 [Periplaneta americana]